MASALAPDLGTPRRPVGDDRGARGHGGGVVVGGIELRPVHSAVQHGSHVPIASGLPSLRSKATTDSGVSRPVFGFSTLGTFSTCNDNRAASDSTSIR